MGRPTVEKKIPIFSILLYPYIGKWQRDALCFGVQEPGKTVALLCCEVYFSSSGGLSGPETVRNRCFGTREVTKRPDNDEFTVKWLRFF